MLEHSDNSAAPGGNGFLAQIRDDWVKHREGQPGSLEGLNPPLKPPLKPPWDDAWLYRRRAARVFIVSIGALLLEGFLGDLLPLSACALVVLFGMASVVVSGVQLLTFTCPRCGRRFATVQKTRRLRVRDAFARRCLYCGLEAGQRS